uniref:Uncharacterized protein n=1 Tax=Arundo donax TaxID=35708 RepID=A0A0A8Y7K2_ARUDO
MATSSVVSSRTGRQQRTTQLVSPLSNYNISFLSPCK